MANRAMTNSANATMEATPLTAYVVVSTAACSSLSSRGMVAMITRRVTMTDRPATIAIGPAILREGSSSHGASSDRPRQLSRGDDHDVGRGVRVRRRWGHRKPR